MDPLRNKVKEGSKSDQNTTERITFLKRKKMVNKEAHFDTNKTMK